MPVWGLATTPLWGQRVAAPARRYSVAVVDKVDIQRRRTITLYEYSLYLELKREALAGVNSPSTRCRQVCGK